MVFIPPHAYFDQEIFDQEMETIFSSSLKYIGHENLVPNIGDFHTLQHENNGRALIHTSSGIGLISNICRHRQAIILQGVGNTNHITCPIHKWSWKLSGEMQAAPYFSENPCKNLRTWDLQNWRGLLFEGLGDISKDLQGVGHLDKMNFQDYLYHRTEYHECNYNWKTFMEVFGDDYHVAPFHPGLSSMIDIKSLKVTEGEGWHMQEVKSSENLVSRTTPTYEKWRKKCLEQGSGILPEYGAIWIGYYPNVMVEIYPFTITISTIYPINPQKTLNRVEFFYRRDTIGGLIESQEEAFMETVHEDDELAESMDMGRLALMKQNAAYSLPDNELVGPYHIPMEIGTKHFQEWYTSKMSR